MSKELNGMMKKLMNKSKKEWDKQEAERKKKLESENESPEQRKLAAYALLGQLYMEKVVEICQSQK